MDTLAFQGVDRAKQNELLVLCTQFNERRDTLLQSCAATDLVYEALDLDLGTILIQVLPIVISLFTGGMSLPIVLGLVKTLVGLFVKNTELAAIVNQIIEAVLGFVSVK